MNYEKMTTSELLDKFFDYNDDIVAPYDKDKDKKVDTTSWFYFDHLPIELLAELIRRVK